MREPLFVVEQTNTPVVRTKMFNNDPYISIDDLLVALNKHTGYIDRMHLTSDLVKAAQATERK
jgi:hypothetical protein